MPKTKKNIKVRDLKPSKDAKGGGGHPVLGGGKAEFGGGGKAGTGGGKAGTGSSMGGSKDFGTGMN
jgi:hypothetical protein